MSDKVGLKFDMVNKVADHVPAMLAYWDKNLVCRYANSSYLDWFEQPAEELIDKVLLPGLLEAHFFLNSKHISGVLDGKVQIFEREIPVISGESRKSIATYTPDFEGNKVIGFFVHLAQLKGERDVSLIVNTESKIAQAIDNLPYRTQIIDQVALSLKSDVLSIFPGIESLAKKHFISSTSLKRGFKAKFKCTLFSFYRTLQMEIAENYLTEKKWSKKQASAHFSFANQSNFNDCYRKYLDQKNNRLEVIALQLEYQDLHKTLVSQLPSSVAMLGRDFRYLACSKLWVTYYNLNEQEVIGTEFKGFFLEYSSRHKAMFKRCLDGETLSSNGDEVLKDDGSRCWIKWDLRPWYNHQQQIAGVIITTEDVTSIKVLDAANIKLFEVLNKTNEISRISA
ncbi:hypothetical protein A0256_23755 [Mucilaginibacter sp. PAMC 26640]|nr:hypothetical protein A0256_23755 [Mucilaginibacter sp. PAMC 26640]